MPGRFSASDPGAPPPQSSPEMVIQLASQAG